MQKHFLAWRVHAAWLDLQVDLPALPFEWLRGPKSQPPDPPDYPCYAVVFDAEAAAETVRVAFAGGLHKVSVVPNTRATAAEWHRVKHAPGSAYILAGQREPRGW